MAFKNIRFPTGIRYGAASGPMFSNSIAKTLSGRSKRNANFESPLRMFRVERALKTDALRQAFINFIYVMGGMEHTFRIKDHVDFEVGSGEGVFRALGNSQFQMEKRYTSGAYSRDVDILLPVSGTIAIPGMTENVHYTIDYTVPEGIVTTIGSPTQTPSSWTGEYDIHARFDVDEILFVHEDIGLFMSQSIAIIEERNIE